MFRPYELNALSTAFYWGTAQMNNARWLLGMSVPASHVVDNRLRDIRAEMLRLDSPIEEPKYGAAYWPDKDRIKLLREANTKLSERLVVAEAEVKLEQGRVAFWKDLKRDKPIVMGMDFGGPDFTEISWVKSPKAAPEADRIENFIASRAKITDDAIASIDARSRNRIAVVIKEVRALADAVRGATLPASATLVKPPIVVDPKFYYPNFEKSVMKVPLTPSHWSEADFATFEREYGLTKVKPQKITLAERIAAAARGWHKGA